MNVDHANVTVHTMAPVRDVHTLTAWALARGVDLPGLTLTRPSLEEVYLRLTGESDDEH
jgi:ABC-2 type transport system ATP-binding protein